MSTVTLWLLISFGRGAWVVERFATPYECERVAATLRADGATMRCVQATIARGPL
jgi:hypothetical protein